MGIAGGTISALGYTLGPVLGGLLTHAFGWRSNFYLSSALAMIGFGAAWVLLPRDSFHGAAAQKEPFDFLGMISFGVSVSLLLCALALAQRGEWQTAMVGATLLAGIVALAFFIRWEKRTAHPLLDLALFRIPAFTLGNSARLISFIAMSVSNLLMPFFLQLVLRQDPLAAGFLIAPTPLAMALLAPLTGWMSDRFLPERLCALGLAVTGIAFVFLAFLQAGSAPTDVVFGLALLGVGVGIFQTPNNNLLMSSVPRHRLGVGSSVLSIVRSLGYSFGAALAAAIVSAHLAAVTGETSLQSLGSAAAATAAGPALTAFLNGFRSACIAAALLCFAGAAISAVRVSREYR
jgi:MFS family permease